MEAPRGITNLIFGWGGKSDRELEKEKEKRIKECQENKEAGKIVKPKDEGNDLYRDTLIRYCGYANELGESLRYVVPRFLKPSYVIAFGYVLMDAQDKAWAQYTRECDTMTL